MPATSESTRRAVIELIGVDVVSRRAPETARLRNVNWVVREEDFWVVMGLHDSGKTDLLTTAAALSKPLAGTYRLFGQEICPDYDNECLAERLRVGLVFSEGGRLFNHLTVWENIALPLAYHRSGTPAENQSRVLELLERVEMVDSMNRLPSSLSVNWRQRVALARALALKPQVLLLDHPLAGMDQRHSRWWVDFLTRLAQGQISNEQTTTIVVAADDLQPWKAPNRRYALLEQESFLTLESGPAYDTQRFPSFGNLPGTEPDLT